MPGGAGAIGELDHREAVDDAGSGWVSACDSCLDSSDPLTAGSQAAAENVTQTGGFRAEHQCQQGPVHLGVILAGSGVNRDGVRGVGEGSVQSRVVVAGYLGRVVEEFFLALLRSQNVGCEGVNVGPGGADRRKPLLRRDGRSGHHDTLGSV